MNECYVYLSRLEGDSWVRADQILGIYKDAGMSTPTQVHLMNKEVIVTDMQPMKVFYQIQEAWRISRGG